MEHLASSAALLHALQSISFGHRQYFDRACSPICLQQRNMPLRQVQKELQEKSVPLVAIFLSIFMLGISAPWLDESFQDIGLEHFRVARAILDKILSSKENWKDPAVRAIIGFYLFWDMAISPLIEPSLLPPLDTSELQEIISEMDEYPHSIGGFLIRIFYFLGLMNRYLRSVMDGNARDLVFEFDLEDQLIKWNYSHENKHFESLADSFRSQGLVLLYRAKSFSPAPGFDVEDISEKISEQPRQTVIQLLETSITENCFNMQATPLTLAVAEYVEECDGAIARLKAIYSMSRVGTLLSAASLLEELWELRDCGIDVTYYELMGWKGWKLNLV